MMAFTLRGHGSAASQSAVMPEILYNRRKCGAGGVISVGGVGVDVGGLGGVGVWGGGVIADGQRRDKPAKMASDGVNS